MWQKALMSRRTVGGAMGDRKSPRRVGIRAEVGWARKVGLPVTAGNGVWAGRAVGRWVLRLVPTGATEGADGCYDGCTPRWYAGRRRLGGGRAVGLANR